MTFLIFIVFRLYGFQATLLPGEFYLVKFIIWAKDLFPIVPKTGTVSKSTQDLSPALSTN